jgi:hypothetical protein
MTIKYSLLTRLSKVDIQYNLGNLASVTRQVSATLYRFVQAMEADLCSFELGKLTYLDPRYYTVFQFFSVIHSYTVLFVQWWILMCVEAIQF